MKWLRRMRATLRGEKRRRELQEELQFHLEMREQRYVDAGARPEEARRRARLRFGNPVVWREKVSAIDLLLFPQTILQDLRFGIRILLRNPGFTAVAVFALAIGIGINTATFTGYEAFFTRKVDARDPATMANLALVEQNGDTNPLFSYPDYEAYRDHLHSFSGVIAASLPQSVTLRTEGGVVQHADAGIGSLIGKLGFLPTGLGGEETAETLMVSDNYFRMLGVGPTRGRDFAPGAAGSGQVLISENYWHKRFSDDPNILGKAVLLDGVPFTIIGVTPHNFVGTYISAPDFWMRLKDEPRIHPGDSWLRDRENFRLHLLGRLAPGMSMTAAQAELTLEANQVRLLHPAHAYGAQPVHGLVWPGSPFPKPLGEVHKLRICLIFVIAAVGLVLVVACANVAALQMARAAARQNELAMRRSLGASRARLIRQLLTESGLLAVTAGIFAFLFSWAFLQVLVVAISDAFPDALAGSLVFHVAPDLKVFAFVLLISLIAGFLFGLTPALESSGSATSSALKANASTSPRRGHRIRGLLVATQVAVSAVLVIAGSLLIHSAIRAVAMSTGYDDAHTLDVSLQFPMTAAYTPDHEAALVHDLRNRLATMPGVLDVTVARAPDGEMLRDGFVSIGDSAGGETPSVHNMKADLYYTWVQPNYFETLGIPLLLGRGLTRSDEQEHSVVLSESAARALWPSMNPLGRKLRMGTDGRYNSATEPLPDGPEWQVVGVARDTRGVMLDGSDSAQVYLPLPANFVQNYPLLIRTRSDPAQSTAAVAAAVASVDSNVSATAQTLEQMLVQTPPFLAPALAASFASITGLLGLVLAAIGIYGTVSYIVVLRTREVGIRMAMGAKKRDILGLILSESTRPVVAGLAAGVLLACGVAWLLRHVLYGIRTIDGISFAGVSLLFLVIAVVAAVIPSRRAMRVDPVVALRYE